MVFGELDTLVPVYAVTTHKSQGSELVGQKKAIAIAVRNVSGRRRWSKLREWLAVAWVLRALPDLPTTRL
jgi:exodeoxyribonuclease V alpha subunit